MAAGVLHKCDFEGQEEIELFVQMAIPLGDGEAACFAIAAKRGWALATDDRRAGRFAADASLASHHDARVGQALGGEHQASDEEIAAVLQNIQRFACFTPRANAPEYAWWISCLGEDGK